MMATGSGTKDDPWVLKTPPGTSEYTMYRDDASDPPTIVCQVGVPPSAPGSQLRFTVAWRATRVVVVVVVATVGAAGRSCGVGCLYQALLIFAMRGQRHKRCRQMKRHCA